MLPSVCGEKDSYTGGDINNLVQPLWKSVWKTLKRLKLKFPDDSAVPFLGIFPNSQFTTEIHRTYSCYCCTFHNSKEVRPVINR